MLLCALHDNDNDNDWSSFSLFIDGARSVGSGNSVTNSPEFQEDSDVWKVSKGPI